MSKPRVATGTLFKASYVVLGAAISIEPVPLWRVGTQPAVSEVWG